MLRRLFLAQRRFFTDARLKIATLIIELAHLPVGHSLFDIRHWIFALASMSNTEHPTPNREKSPGTRCLLNPCRNAQRCDILPPVAMLCVATLKPPIQTVLCCAALFLAQRRFFTDARLKMTTLIIELAHLPVGHSLFDIRHWIFAFASMSNTEHPTPNREKSPGTRCLLNPCRNAQRCDILPPVAMLCVATLKPPIQTVLCCAALFLAQRRFFTAARLKIATLIIELAHLPVGHSLFDIRHWIFAFASMSNTEHPTPNREKSPGTRCLLNPCRNAQRCDILPPVAMLCVATLQPPPGRHFLQRLDGYCFCKNNHGVL
jgi:hypothetical protein